MTGDWYADLVERLFAEFDDQYPLPHIVEVARQCREELCCAPPAALPELIERLARQRLAAAESEAE
jgi:hypothetical protein